MLPAACFANTGLSPKPGGTIKIKKSAGPASRGLFQHKVTVQENGLSACQPGVRSVDVTPTRLNHANLGICKVIDTLFQNVRWWHKIGIQNKEKLAFGLLKAVVQSPGLKAHTILPPQYNGIESSFPEF